MIKNAVADRMHLLEGESAFTVLARARALEEQGRHIIHMEIGQPDFETPPNIIDAGCKAITGGYTGYTPAPGYPELRQAVTDYAKRYKNVDASREDVVITTGTKPVIFYTMLMLVNPGDEVIYPNPGFPAYNSCIRFVGGIPVPLKLSAENDFRLDPDEFKELITEKTKLIILNSPSNPTGGVFTREDILEIANILKDRPDIFILSDEIYDRLVYDDEACSIASIPGFKGRTIIADGLSKAYAMTGWRLGYGIMHPDLAKHMELLVINSNSCAAAFTQIAAIEALSGSQNAVESMCADFLQRRDYLTAALNAIDGISCRLPRGAFYVFPDISSFGLPCELFAERLLNEAGVAASWGTAFGKFGEGHIRLSYATSLDNIKIAIDRIEQFTKTL